MDPIALPPTPVALSDTVVVSIAGIAVSGVFGPLVIGLLARWRQRTDHRHERRLKRHDDLAALLDDAAKMLAPAATRLRAAWEEGIRKKDLDLRELRGWTSEVHVTYERLLLRLSEDDPISQAYEAARERLVELGELIGRQADENAIEEAADRFQDARSLFLQEARRRIEEELAGR